MTLLLEYKKKTKIYERHIFSVFLFCLFLFSWRYSMFSPGGDSADVDWPDEGFLLEPNTLVFLEPGVWLEQDED